MADLLIERSAVEKRRLARKNISIAVCIVIISLLCMAIGSWFSLIGGIGLLYSIYKGFFKGLLCLWIYKE